MPDAGHVHELALAVVKGTRLSHPASAVVDRDGLRDDRRFHVVDAKDLQEGALSSALGAIDAEWDAASRQLSLTFPDGSVVSAAAEPAEPVTASVYWTKDHVVEGRAVPGPWDEALSDHLGHAVRLVEAAAPGRARDIQALTLLSLASIAKLEQEMGIDGLGTGRFRMNLILDGPDAHGEDGWYGRRLAVGDCVLRVTGPVPRCAVVTRDPATGTRDQPTLKGIMSYRPPITPPGGEEVRAPFGVYAVVEEEGAVAAGVPIEVLD